MHDRLAGLATARGELIPVLVREAIGEYLAKRLDPAAAAPERQAILDALTEKPAVLDAMISLAEALRGLPPPSPSKADTRRKILEIVASEVKKRQPPPK